MEEGVGGLLLPASIVEIVLSYLPTLDMVRCALLNKQFYDVLSMGSPWHGCLVPVTKHRRSVELVRWCQEATCTSKVWRSEVEAALVASRVKALRLDWGLPKPAPPFPLDMMGKLSSLRRLDIDLGTDDVDFSMPFPPLETLSLRLHCPTVRCLPMIPTLRSLDLWLRYTNLRTFEEPAAMLCSPHLRDVRMNLIHLGGPTSGGVSIQPLADVLGQLSLLERLDLDLSNVNFAPGRSGLDTLHSLIQTRVWKLRLVLGAMSEHEPLDQGGRELSFISTLPNLRDLSLKLARSGCRDEGLGWLDDLATTPSLTALDLNLSDNLGVRRRTLQLVASVCQRLTTLRCLSLADTNRELEKMYISFQSLPDLRVVQLKQIRGECALSAKAIRVGLRQITHLHFTMCPLCNVTAADLAPLAEVTGLLELELALPSSSEALDGIGEVIGSLGSLCRLRRLVVYMLYCRLDPVECVGLAQLSRSPALRVLHLYLNGNRFGPAVGALGRLGDISTLQELKLCLNENRIPTAALEEMARGLVRLEGLRDLVLELEGNSITNDGAWALAPLSRLRWLCHISLGLRCNDITDPEFEGAFHFIPAISRTVDVHLIAKPGLVAHRPPRR